MKYLEFDKNLKLEIVKKIHLEYSDNFLEKIILKLTKKNNKLYNNIGSKFNANNLIENLLSDDNNDLKIFDKNFDFDIKIDEVFLDKEYTVYEFKWKF